MSSSSDITSSKSLPSSNLPIAHPQSTEGMSPFSLSCIKGETVAKAILRESVGTANFHESLPYGSSYGSDKSFTSVASEALTYTGENNPLSQSVESVTQIVADVKTIAHIRKHNPTRLFIHNKTKHGYAELPQEIRKYFSQKDYEQVELQINHFGLANIRAAVETNQIQEDFSIKDHKIIYKPSGKVYVKLEPLGQGGFKDTAKYFLIASANKVHMKHQPLILRAYSEEQHTNQTQDPKYIEQMRKSDEHESQIVQFLKYAKSIPTKDLSHVNIIKSVTNTALGKGYMAEVFEGNITRLFKRTPPLTVKERWNIASQMTKAVCQLSSVGVRHRDIHPENFLYKTDQNGDLIVKITDFGKSTMTTGALCFEESDFMLTISDPLWAKEEDPTHPIYVSEASEVYQLGHALCMLFNGLSPLEYTERIQQDKRRMLLSSNTWKQFPDQLSVLNDINDPSTRQFLLRMLNPKPTQENPRPTLAETRAFVETKFAQAT